MIAITLNQLARDIDQFLMFKRALGHRYHRGELTLRSFQRFARGYLESQKPLPKRAEKVFEQVLKAWLARSVSRKAISAGLELGVLRQFCLYRRRRDPMGFVPERDWAPQTESTFQPRILSHGEVRGLLHAAARHRGRNISAGLLHTLLLILYCTGLRLGEAVRLQIPDLDLERRVFTVRHSKGKSRLVPFGADLAREISRYLGERAGIAMENPAPTTEALFLRLSGRPLSVCSASDAIRALLRSQGLKPAKGRAGARPYDLRHAFAVHRLTDWYRRGIDVHARLPWLSAYMGHDNVLGTEVYLHATTELLAHASSRFAGRVRRSTTPR